MAYEHSMADDIEFSWRCLDGDELAVTLKGRMPFATETKFNEDTISNEFANFIARLR